MLFRVEQVNCLNVVKRAVFEAVMQRFTAIMIGLWLVIGFALVVLSTR